MSLASLAPRPGTLTWLALHDLKLSWRRFLSVFGSLRPRTSMLIVGVALLAFHLISIPVALWFRTAEPGGANALHFYPAMASAVLFVMPWLVSQALTSTTRALYTRNDLDLLLASPLPPRLVLAARALAIGCESIGSVAIFLLPIANMNALLVGWQWLAVYPALVATGLICTSLGIGLTLLLFLIAGPRRTRLVSQIVATIIGAGFIFTLQALHVLPEGTRLSIVAAIESPGNSIIFDKSGWLWLPVRAAAGEPIALILWCSISILIFAATALLLGERFALSAVHSGGTAASVSRKRNKGPVRFRPGLGRALRLKEWRLLGRDPWLLSQIMLQVIYTLPVSIVIWRSHGAEWLDGHIHCARHSRHRGADFCLAGMADHFERGRAGIPRNRSCFATRDRAAQARSHRGAPVLFLAAPLLALAWASVELALYTFVFTAGAAASTAFLNFWHPMPGRRVAVLRRHSQSKLIAMLEHLLSLLWAVAMVLCVVDSWYALVPLGMIAGILWLNRPRNTVSTAHVARQAPA